MKGFFKEESGQGLVEYALILGLVSIVAAVALITLGDKIAELFTRASNKISA